MVTIGDKYRINGTDTDYIAQYRKERKKADKKAESGDFGLIGYYSSFENAVKAVAEYETRERITGGDYDLKSALAEIRKIKAEFAALLK